MRLKKPLPLKTIVVVSVLGAAGIGILGIATKPIWKPQIDKVSFNEEAEKNRILSDLPGVLNRKKSLEDAKILSISREKDGKFLVRVSACQGTVCNLYKFRVVATPDAILDVIGPSARPDSKEGPTIAD